MWTRNTGGIVNVISGRQVEDSLDSTTEVPASRSNETASTRSGNDQVQSQHDMNDSTPGPISRPDEAQAAGQCQWPLTSGDANVADIQPLFAGSGNLGSALQDSNDMQWLLGDLSDQGLGDAFLNWTPNYDEPVAADDITSMLARTSSVQSDLVWEAVRNRIFASADMIPPGLLAERFFEPVNLGAFYHSYFDNYHPQFPILHRPTLDPKECPLVLLLAMLALGATLHSDVAHYHSSIKLHGHLRGVIFNVSTSTTYQSTLTDSG